MKKSWIDDVRLPTRYPKWGYQILFPNNDIRRMLNLVKATPDDIFYDLGCGWGQNLIIALTEFRLKKVVGIEDDAKRINVAIKRLKKIEINGEWHMLQNKFEDLFHDKIKDFNLSEATIVFYGLNPSKDVLKGLEKKLRKGCRLITYFNCLFPEIMPDTIDYPFYVSRYPFHYTKTAKQWLNTVVQKRKSTLKQSEKIGLMELWEEFSHDFEILGIRNQISMYRRRFKKLGF